MAICLCRHHSGQPVRYDPESLFAAFQMTFAIITPALIIGAYVERIRFSAVLIFSAMAIDCLCAALPIGYGRRLYGSDGCDGFAGGIVVHTTAGTAALVAALVIGERRNFPFSVQPPHSPVLTMIGACMLWIGWFGFNGGSALAAGGGAAINLLVTHISAAVASLVWMVIEWRKFGRPSLVGIVIGMVAGLATVTPASGFIGVPGGIILGLAGGYLCYVAVDIIRNRLHIDDSLDVFAVHGVGGIIGSLLVAVLATDSFSGLGLADGISTAGSAFRPFVFPSPLSGQRLPLMQFSRLPAFLADCAYQKNMRQKGWIFLNMASAVTITANLVQPGL